MPAFLLSDWNIYIWLCRTYHFVEVTICSKINWENLYCLLSSNCNFYNKYLLLVHLYKMWQEITYNLSKRYLIIQRERKDGLWYISNSNTSYFHKGKHFLIKLFKRLNCWSMGVNLFIKLSNIYITGIW